MTRKLWCIFIPILMAASTSCASSGTEKVTTSTTRSDNSTTSKAAESSQSASTERTLEQCEKIRSAPPQEVEYDSWDAPGVITTDVEIDINGNKYISGYISDENDFDYKDSTKTVGVHGIGFQFIAKFNPQSEFEWMRCLRESSLNHWYKGPVIETDKNGSIYVCDSTLERWTPAGKLDWSSEALRWNSENISDVTHNCSTSPDGLTIVTGVDETSLVSPEGIILWKKDLGWNSTAEFLSNNLIALASNSSTMVVNRKGDIIWENTRNQRDDLGPDGLTTNGIGNTYSTDQTGLATVNDGLLIATTINKRTDFDPSSKSLAFTPRWIQEIVVAKYSLSGTLRWATKMQPPTFDVNKNDARYFEVFDSQVGEQGELFVFGGGSNATEHQPMRLFVAKFSPSGEQLRFMWLEEYTSFIHNMGRYIDIDTRGHVYGTVESLRVPPFIWSRNLTPST